METFLFRLFETYFKIIGVLLLSGMIFVALIDAQKHAFESKRRGLASLLHTNQQLVGITK